MSLNNVRAVGDDRPWKDEVERELKSLLEIIKYGKITIRSAGATGGGGGGGGTSAGADAITATLPATYDAVTYTIGVDQDSFDRISNLDYAQFDTTTAAAGDIGRLMWNDTDGTLEFGLKGGNVTLQIGQEQVVRVRNNTGSTLNEGTVCYFSGSNGTNFNVVPALASADATSAQTMGVLTETLNTSSTQHGFLTTFGLVRNIDLSYISGLTDGDQLYLDGTTAGRMTRTKPSAPTHLVYVGICLSAGGGGTNSTIFVKVQNGYELDEIHDVSITGPVANNEILAYTLATDLWENKTGPEAGLAITTGNNTFTGTQTFTPAATTGQPVIIKALASQTGNLLEVQNSSSTIMARINSTGGGVFTSLFSSTGATLTGGATISQTAANVPLTVRGAVSQTGDLQQWQNSSSTVLAKIDKTGNATAASFIKTGGTSTEFLKADGSVDSSTYIANGASSVELVNPKILRDNTSDEGGQLNFARASDNATYWYIDSYGSTSTPALRFVSGTNNYFQFNADGSFALNGSTGTSGQVLQSTGASTPPQWATVSGTSSNSFTTINAPAGTDPTATSSTDTLNLANGTGISITGDSATKTITTAIANTTVTAASYGSATQVPTFTVNAQGQLTAAANATISFVPTGSVQMYAGSSTPTDWLLCDGTAVSRTTYSALFAVIGTTYGAGNGSTTFNLPNMTSKFPRGGTTPSTGGGSDTHIHTLTPGTAFAQGGRANNQWEFREYSVTPSWVATSNITGTGNTDSSTSTTGIGVDGDTDSATAVPAYVQFRFIIKT